MSTTRLIARIAIAIALAGGTVARAAAQAVRPYRPVFAMPLQSTNGTFFNLHMDLAEAFDSNVLGEQGAVVPSPLVLSGTYTSASPSFDFAYRNTALQVAVVGNSNVRRYQELGTVVGTTHALGASVRASLTSQTTVSATETVTYAPAYLSRLFTSIAPTADDALAPAGSNFAVDNRRSYAVGTTAAVIHTMTPRATLSFTGSARRTNYLDPLPGAINLRAYDAGGSFAYSLSRSTKVHVGYTYRDATYSPTLHPLEHDLDVGLEYQWRLSPSRVAMFTATVGPRLLSTHTPAPDVPAPQAAYAYRLTGDGSIDYPLNRTWHLAAGYRRGLVFLDPLPAPIFSNGVTASARGFFSRRLEASVSTGYSTGHLEFGHTVGALVTYTGSTRLQAGLTRMAAVYVEYVLYYYDLGAEIELAPGFPHHLNRNGVRVGLNLWAPVGTGHRAAR